MRITIEIPDTGLEEDILRKGEWEDDSLFGRSIRNALMNFTSDSLEQEPKTEWIPVSEKLPEDDDLYFVTFNDGEIDLVAFDRGDFSYSGVIAWCKLPEPYKESEGSE